MPMGAPGAMGTLFHDFFTRMEGLQRPENPDLLASHCELSEKCLVTGQRPARCGTLLLRTSVKLQLAHE